MATYFHHGSSEIQTPDGLTHTLYLMNPNNYVPTYSDTQQEQQSPPAAVASMFLLNPAAAVSAPTHPGRHLAGIPVLSSGPGSNNLPDHHGEIPPFHGISGVAAAPPPRLHYNLWAPTDQVAVDVVSPMGFRRQAVSPTQQALSLSLSSSQQTSTAYATSLSGENEVVPGISPTSCDDIRAFPGNSMSSAVSNGIGNSAQSVLLGSKYLKAAHELLDEVVNVGSTKGVKTATTDSADGGREKTAKIDRESTPAAAIGGSYNSGGESSCSKQGAELSTAQRQELQVKKAKLARMLDEVEQRYRQYHHQMQVVISTFEEAAGFGSAKSYTALGLKTISKQFRCLKDAISSQIKAASKSLGEEECLGVKIEGSRLRYVDHHLRQQRALQQLGMIQHNAWRPQRGLPERAVSVLRAWLFEHFLHPYPKTADKVILAKQTGLTRSQVSNWFINARVRLWKPMVEEMYMEETKEQERNNGSTSQSGQTKKTEPNEEPSSANITSTSQVHDMMNAFQSSKPDQNFATEFPNSPLSTSPMPGSFHFGTTEIQAISPKKQRSTTTPTTSEVLNSPSSILSMDNMDMCRDQMNHQRQRKYNTVGFGAYPVGDLGRFHLSADHHHHQLAPRFHGNGVSLTLGLPHCENHSLSNQNIIDPSGTRLDNSIGTGSESTGNYDNMDMQSRKRFVAQLLPDFVA
ncbi:BEL1-like homeodomain protein 1 [Morus notabilis]|uniref:BEL1-like homeodomain protein 1 n=1 Tax=Morus notabilis TaxID=981085 RepID=W9R5A7_9ROSA|nr:BEL1-like homeodomain protein 1 [Morus notabilis]XP_024017018.1 BEL1-like homeodomain protein 1 [Morus notabilis]XP_024017019.1 BEL1-like homeodomain protein 1 [Morus notabilis]XP_024017020.1 BEL1-like homeodomain protein 1 [Morus notabilis]EXB38411.1 BEL1-like homeodomain protein 1 [Morus notabilis]